MPWKQAQACVDWGVNAYFAKKDASEEDLASFLNFIKSNYSVDILPKDKDDLFYITAQNQMDQEDSVCFSKTWALLNIYDSVGITWVHEYKCSDETISHCDSFFDDLVTKFQEQNNISNGTDFYKGC